MEKQILELMDRFDEGNMSINDLEQELLVLYNVSLSLLGIAKCPNSNCDNNGTIAYQTTNGDWEPEPCEWCHKKKELLNNEG